ncbi:MAG: IS30 family transposase [Burkholderiales bacterium]|nr:IS30 family transposase [Burkholderiales bacterium]
MEFTHLKAKQRSQIERLLASKTSVSEIATAVGVDRSTIYREIKRGKVNQKYNALASNERTLKRIAKSAANHPTKPKEIWPLVRHLLNQEWSPDEISARLRIAGSEENWSISHQTIYNWIRRTKSALNKKLRRYQLAKVWKPAKSSYPAGRKSIRQRPKDALAREIAGHWEGDTIRGQSHHHCLLTLVERKSLYTKISPVLQKTAITVAAAVGKELNGLPALSLTLDNGCEFAHFKDMGLPVFFADPGRPRQRSRNENTNGLIRQYIPKRMRLKTLSRARIQHIEDRLNHRPRKTLGYKTPHEVLFNLTPNSVAIRT